MAKTPEQKILELEAKIRLLEKQKARAEHLAERADKKVIIFDMLVIWPKRNTISKSEKITIPGHQSLQRRTRRNSNYFV